jgi:acyl phosphate:glycerol-3-phosphate acyltransferase
MPQFYLAMCCVVAYLLGSIPTAFWYGTGFYGIDIRLYGSKNAGATNTFRVLGKNAGIVVLLIDVLKGWVATSLALGLYYLHVLDTSEMEDWKLIFGILAVLGHLFPIFSGFRGGKGVATLCGMLISINILVALSCMGVFLVVFVLFHYVSLSSMMAALSFPSMMLLGVFGKEETPTLVFAVVIFMLVVFMHRKNIKRIWNNQETKMYLLGKPKPDLEATKPVASPDRSGTPQSGVA